MAKFFDFFTIFSLSKIYAHKKLGNFSFKINDTFKYIYDQWENIMLNFRYLATPFLILSLLPLSGYAAPVSEPRGAQSVVKQMQVPIPTAVTSFSGNSVMQGKKLILKWVADKNSKKFLVTIDRPTSAGFLLKRTVSSPQITPAQLPINRTFLIKVTPLNNKNIAGASSTVLVTPYKVSKESRAINYKINVGSTLNGSIATPNIKNMLGDGKTPNLKMTLMANGQSWASFSINYDGTGGVPSSTDGDSDWSSWNVTDSATGTYYGNLVLTNTTKKIQLEEYTDNSGAGDSYLVNPRIDNSTSSNASISAQSVICYYCETDTVALKNLIGTGINPSISLVLGNNANNPENTPKENLTLGYGTSTIGIPDSWSVWNAVDSDGHYFGTISLNKVGSNITYTKYDKPTSPSTEYLENIIPSTDTAPSPDIFSISATVVCGACKGPFPNAPAATAPSNATFTTLGKQLLLNGAPVRLKGVARPSLEWASMGNNFSETDIKNMKAKGANTIRVGLNTDFWLNSASVTTIGSYKQIVDAIVYYATENNMAVILDYHWFSSATEQDPMALKDSAGSSLQFWTEVATKYKDFGNVMFELYNEPYDLSYDEWLHGNGTYYGMQDLYDTVRATGAKNVVMISGLDYAYYLGFISDVKNCAGETCFVKDSSGLNGLAVNAMYNSHPYTIHKGSDVPDTHHYKGENGYTYTGVPADFTTNFQGVKDLYPIIFTEFGDNNETNYTMEPTFYASANQAMINEANTMGIHYTA